MDATQKMIRLSPEAVAQIVEAFHAAFTNADHLWIFGSRVDPKARGGDIDLYIETPELDTAVITERRASFLANIWQALGEQKIDIVVRMTADTVDLPIYREAIAKGIKLA